MNSLSWMLYLAEVAGSVSAAAGFCAFLAAIGLVGSTVAVAMEDEEFYFNRPLAWVFISCLLIACVIPGKRTVYAIAASEMGEQALQSKTAGKAMQALDAWLDKQIKGEGK